MTCKHQPGDPSCSSSPEGIQRAEAERRSYARAASATPDPDKFEVLEFQEVGKFLVLKAKYTSCTRCSYEGTKIMVFSDASIRDLVFWKKIDPHFREPRKFTPATNVREAPSPIARFPGTSQGWVDAIGYAKMKTACSNP